jgi:glutathione S-transferase
MRARVSIAYSGAQVGLREVVLKDKPTAMLGVSPKGTVPVLIDIDGTVIEESLDVMRWALAQNDPENWLDGLGLDDPLILTCDDEFKHWLDRYKYAVRFPEQNEQWYREQGELFLDELEQLLTHHRYLRSDSLSAVDVAVMPFVRQFAGVDTNWWSERPYPQVATWLEQLLEGDLFKGVMKKYPRWQEGDPAIPFPS